jgi:predicted nucleic-acid-binding protein
MIAIDTNILVRYAVKDDPKQTVAATDFLRSNRCFICKTVVLELVWVLSSSAGYALPRKAVVERLRHILGLSVIEAEAPLQLARAIDWYDQGMDFADALHLSSSEGLDAFATMDGKLVARAAKIASGCRIIAV